ncbi:MAG: electron transport complex subunit RsxC [Proteiniphilum sp.]|jgi:electron transport complex protein RnfC|nr:electron transport complex subunit RsxC [Proteiniphilum sp.]
MLKTFRIGGIHPKEKKISAGKAIQPIVIPDQVIIPLSQHIGAPCQPVVKKGDNVKVGTLIGKSVGFVSANIHSPVSGTVLKIDKSLDASGYKRDSVFIKVEGDEWEASVDRSPDLKRACDLAPGEILNKIATAGIVGMGGATFPSHVKLTPPPGTKAEILIINGVECEPWLTSDHQLMMEKSDEILVGTTIVMKALNVQKAVIGIENNKQDAIRLFTQKVKEYDGITVQPLKVQYPQGGEKQLIDALTGRQIPSGALPISVGAVVQNVGTIFAIYEAVQKNKPLIERVVTVTGKEVKQPCNILSRVGIPLNKLIDVAGGLPETTGKVVSGGPMMGKALASIDIPVSKGTSGILIIPTLEAKRKTMKDCIRCARCISVCPMGLNPTLLMNLTEYEVWDRAEKEHIIDCIECGSCSYTCPADRPLLDYIRLGKGKVNGIIRARKN